VSGAQKIDQGDSPVMRSSRRGFSGRQIALRPEVHAAELAVPPERMEEGLLVVHLPHGLPWAGGAG
jgi:hypothetical protein